MYIDTHAHILYTFYSDINCIINEILKSNIGKVVNIATTLEECHEVISLSKKYPYLLFPALGLHPEIAEEETIEELNHELDEMETLITKDTCALGEMGLDYKGLVDNPQMDEIKEKQMMLFKRQIDMAIRHNLP